MLYSDCPGFKIGFISINVDEFLKATHEYIFALRFIYTEPICRSEEDRAKQNK